MKLFREKGIVSKKSYQNNDTIFYCMFFPQHFLAIQFLPSKKIKPKMV